MNTEKPVDNEALKLFKDSFNKYEKEQLIELLVTYSVANYNLQETNKKIHDEFLKALNTNSDNTIATMENIHKTFKEIIENVPKLKVENISLWIAVAVETVIIILLLFRR